MVRRLPVIQPNALERRAFLVGIASAIVACSAESTTTPRGGGSSSSSSGGTKDGGGSSSGDGGGSSSGDDGGSSSGDDGGSSGFDSGVQPGKDAGPKGCLAVGKDVGPPGSFAMGTVTFIAALNAFVGRDAGGLYAMYSLCTHSVGNLNQSGAQLVCTVHGARFSLTGAVQQGPATIPLPHFEICLNSKGNVAVDTDTIVPATTRLNA